jgi:hypothetical protein
MNRCADVFAGHEQRLASRIAPNFAEMAKRSISAAGALETSVRCEARISAVDERGPPYVTYATEWQMRK